MSGLSRFTAPAAWIASRIAVCIGTLKATFSAHSTAAGSHRSTARSRQRTSWPAARRAAAGDATWSGWWPSSYVETRRTRTQGTVVRPPLGLQHEQLRLVSVLRVVRTHERTDPSAEYRLDHAAQFRLARVLDGEPRAHQLAMVAGRLQRLLAARKASFEQ